MASVLTFGETMLRLSPAAVGERLAGARDWRVEPGGSESNVAIALAQLGHAARHYTRVPAGPLGDLVDAHLRGLKVDTGLLARGGDRLGCYWTELGSGPRPGRVIYDREHSAFADWPTAELDWAGALAGVQWLHVSGITPAVSKQAAQNLAAGLTAVPAGVLVSLDLNFRAKLWGWLPPAERAQGIREIMTGLCVGLSLLMGNESDFQDIFGWEAQGDTPGERYGSLAARAFAEFPLLRHLAVSLRDSHSASVNGWSGLLFVREGQEPLMYQGPELTLTDIVDRVGAGDSFAAGIIHGLLSGWEPRDTVDFAVHLSALKHTLRGDPCTFGEAEVRQVMAAGGAGRIIR